MFFERAVPYSLLQTRRFSLKIQPKSLKLRWLLTTPDDGKHSFATAGPRA